MLKQHLSNIKSFLRRQKQKIWRYLDKNPKLRYMLIGMTGVVGFVCFWGYFLVLLVFAGVFGQLPDKAQLAKIEQSTATEIYSTDGQLLGKFYLKNRTDLTYDDIPPNLIKALVATEDKRFYEHGGIDWQAWGRVLIKSVLLQQDAGGGSTITQQLAKNLFPRKNYRVGSLLINKIREVFIAKRLEKVYDKKEIITLYLNTVPFPGNTYGLEVASRQFFQKRPIDLTLTESACLIGTLKANAYFHPVNHPERCLERRNLVLTLLHNQFSLAPHNLDSLQKLPLGLSYRKESHDAGLATYYREFLRQEITGLLVNCPKESGESYNLYTDGLKIYTTVDAKLQAAAEAAVATHLTSLQKAFEAHWSNQAPWQDPTFIENIWKNTDQYQALNQKGHSAAYIDSFFHRKKPLFIYTPEGGKMVTWSLADSIAYANSILHSGFLALDREKGAVRSWVGGIDHRFFKYDHVTSDRQTGSVFKPFVFAAALENGKEPCDYFDNQQLIYPENDNWAPANADNEYGGLYSMAGALQHSINVIAVELLQETGLEKVRNLALEANLPGSIPEVPSIALGTAELSLYDLLPAYGLFANAGKPLLPYHIDSIKNEAGLMIYNHHESTVQVKSVIRPENALIMTEFLKTVVDSGTAQALRNQYGIRSDLAGKTGTTQSHADGWFVGYTPKLVFGSWVGASMPEIHFRSLALGQGSHTALPVCGKFLQTVEKSPELRRWAGGKFEVLPDTLVAKLDCPAYLEDNPSFFDEFFLADEFRKLFEVFKSEEEKESERISRYNEAYSEKIRRRNERILQKRERKKKRKAFFDELFSKD